MEFKQNLEKISEYPEYKLFLIKNDCDSYIRTSKEILSFNDDTLSTDEKNVMMDSVAKVRNIRKCITDEISKRFNFECYNIDGTNTKEYDLWIEKWSNWINKFSDDELEVIIEKILKNEDISEWM